MQDSKLLDKVRKFGQLVGTPLKAGEVALPSFGRVVVVTKRKQLPPAEELEPYLARQVAAAEGSARVPPASAAGPAGAGSVGLREAWRAYVLAPQPYAAASKEVELLKVKKVACYYGGCVEPWPKRVSQSTRTDSRLMLCLAIVEGSCVIRLYSRT